jgi:hypothetical protein
MIHIFKSYRITNKDTLTIAALEKAVIDSREGKFVANKYIVPSDMKCEWCGKEHQNKNSYTQHAIRCSANPDKIDTTYPRPKNGPGENQYTKAKKLGLPKPVVSEETKEKIKAANRGRKHTEETKQKMSATMRQVAKDNPDTYSSSNRGRTKQIEKYGIKFQGSWELKFYEFCIENRIEVLRNFDGFPYIWNGERTYFPDFYLPELNAYVEIKGYKTERDVAKWAYFPHHLIVIQAYEIKQIENSSFQL